MERRKSDSRKGMDSKSRRMQENIAEQAEDFERIKRLPQDNVFKPKKLNKKDNEETKLENPENRGFREEAMLQEFDTAHQSTDNNAEIPILLDFTNIKVKVKLPNKDEIIRVEMDPKAPLFDLVESLEVYFKVPSLCSIYLYRDESQKIPFHKFESFEEAGIQQLDTIYAFVEERVFRVRFKCNREYRSTSILLQEGLVFFHNFLFSQNLRRKL